jgi:branched-subunit amino acid aminotransferase/4-amino-4-deoxychorismate lyase
VLRQSLLDTGEVRERVLTKDDLTTAAAIWRISSLREWVAVRAEWPATSGAECTSASRSRPEVRARDRRTGS